MRNEKTGLVCPGCHHPIVRQEIDNLLVDNRGAWHKACFPSEPTAAEGAKGVSLAA